MRQADHQQDGCNHTAEQDGATPVPATGTSLTSRGRRAPSADLTTSNPMPDPR